LGTADDFVPPTMSGASGSGCAVECVDGAGQPSRSCPTGWLRVHRTRCVVGSRRVSGSQPESRWNRQRRIAKSPRGYLIHRQCAAGHNGDCSAYGGGSRLAQRTRTFCNCPPSPPGIWALL